MLNIFESKLVESYKCVAELSLGLACKALDLATL